MTSGVVPLSDEDMLAGYVQALVEEVEAGQEKLAKAQKQADAYQAKIAALEDQ